MPLYSVINVGSAAACLLFGALYLARVFGQQGRNRVPEEPKKVAGVPSLPPLTAEEHYKNQEIKRFVVAFPTISNANVDAVFSSPAEYREAIKTPDNALECTWRRRILMEQTPQGGILMYYDPFKRGFAYYADTHKPYGLLNAAAMKYVRLFQCRAFFIDEFFWPAGHTSPLTKFELDIIEPKENKTTTARGTSGPFAKLKTYQEEPTTSTLEVHFKNRFVHLGKIVNYNMLQTPKKSKESVTTTTTNLASYKEYKFWTSQKCGSASDVMQDMDPPGLQNR